MHHMQLEDVQQYFLFEYHNDAVSLDNGKWLYTTDGKKASGSAGWGYTQILGRVKHQTFGTLITIEGETQTRVEAFTAPLSQATLEQVSTKICFEEMMKLNHILT